MKKFLLAVLAVVSFVVGAINTSAQTTVYPDPGSLHIGRNLEKHVAKIFVGIFYENYYIPGMQGYFPYDPTEGSVSEATETIIRQFAESFSPTSEQERGQYSLSFLAFSNLPEEDTEIGPTVMGQRKYPITFNLIQDSGGQWKIPVESLFPLEFGYATYVAYSGLLPDGRRVVQVEVRRRAKTYGVDGNIWPVIYPDESSRNGVTSICWIKDNLNPVVYVHHSIANGSWADGRIDPEGEMVWRFSDGSYRKYNVLDGTLLEEHLRTTALPRKVDGGFEVMVQGKPGQSFTVEFATVLTGPWTEVSSLTLLASESQGRVVHKTEASVGFYRAMQVVTPAVAKKSQ